MAIELSDKVGDKMKCDYMKVSGLQCRSNAIVNDSRCFMHSNDPEIVAKRAGARAKGGYAKNSKRLANIPQIKNIDSFADIKAILIDSLNELRTCATTSAVAKTRTVGYLCSIFTELVSKGDLESRIIAIEKQLSQQ